VVVHRLFFFLFISLFPLGILVHFISSKQWFCTSPKKHPHKKKGAKRKEKKNKTNKKKEKKSVNEKVTLVLRFPKEGGKRKGKGRKRTRRSRSWKG